MGGDSIIALRISNHVNETYHIHSGMVDLLSTKCFADYVDLLVEKYGVKDDTDVEESRQELLKPVEPFETFYYRNSYYHAMLLVLRYHQIDILKLLNNDIIVYEEDKQSGMLSVSYKNEQEQSVLLEQLGFKIMESEELPIIQQIQHYIDASHPVFAWVDRYYLPMHEESYQKKHEPHVIIIYGYQEKRKAFHVLDQIPEATISYENGLISYEVLEKACEGGREEMQGEWCFA